MNKYNAKKKDQLGLDFGTATNRLRKLVLFELVKETGRDSCFRCGQKILSPATLSVEHKRPWMDSPDPVGLFFDLTNISFSHLSCNIRLSRKPHKKYFTPEARLEADRAQRSAYMRRTYTTEKRQLKKQSTGW